MSSRPHRNQKVIHPLRQNRVLAMSNRARAKFSVHAGQRSRIVDTRRQGQHMPPEHWHEPAEERPADYRFAVHSPGAGYRHILTPEQIRQRLSLLPRRLVASLEIVQLSRMTRKRHSFPCYGMQWGHAIYLYPVEETLVERYCRPPTPAQRIEAGMYGADWQPDTGRYWKLVWTPETIQDYYLNNILIHELGHLNDARNTSYVDRERFAEWFAIEHGYKPSRQT